MNIVKVTNTTTMFALDCNDTMHIVDAVKGNVIKFSCGITLDSQIPTKIKVIGTYEGLSDKLQIGPYSEVKWCRKCGRELVKYFA